MKKLLAIIGSLMVFIAVNTSQAQSITTTNLTAQTNVVLTAPYHLILIQALSATAQTVNFYDSASTNLVWTNAAYVSTLSYTTNITNVIAAGSTTTGIAQTNIYSGLWTYSVTNAAATNSLLPINTIILAANVPARVAVDARLMRGLAVTLSTTNSATVSVTYRPNIGQ